MSNIAVSFFHVANTVDLFVLVVAAISGVVTAAGYSSEYMHNTSAPTYREGAVKKYPILSKL